MSRQKAGRGPTVAVFPAPEATSGNPYVSRLHAALEQRGVHLIAGRDLTPAWVDALSGEIDVVHLHWLEYIVRDFSGGRVTRAVRTHRRAMSYMSALRRLAAAPARTVWTVHNRRPHESPYPWLEGPLARFTAAQVDALIFHSQTAAQTVAGDLDRPIQAWIANHPHYQGAYPEDRRPRAEKRATYGIDEAAFVYLMFGQIRPYKRVPDAVRAFRRISDADARLVIAGAPANDRIVGEVQRAAADDRRVLALLRHIPDNEVSTLFDLSDAVVLNHREVFSSGALMLGLSYGLPVVAPHAGSARDVAAPPALESFAPGGLPQALRAIRTGPAAKRRAAALDAAERSTYEALADEVLRAYSGEGGLTVRPTLTPAT